MRHIRRNHSSCHLSAYGILIIGILAIAILFGPSAYGQDMVGGQGSLTIIEPDGKPGAICPLEHTSVQAEISGFVARASVTQIFHNPGKEKIEAVYTFPLSADGAVDDMLMKIGDRTIKGVIKTKEEARKVYEAAKEKGQLASLLDQERPNIFTQSVAHILPGEKVEITISYAEVLQYEDGAFKFNFPMVVGPRFIPGDGKGKQGTGWAQDTNRVPDASKITPPVAKEGTRAGHDIDLSLTIQAGVPIIDIKSEVHEITWSRNGDSGATVKLKDEKEIPNRDFVLTINVASDKVKSGYLAHKIGPDGYATIIIIPPKRVEKSAIAPRELIFVVDCSGSQFGLPLEKAKETMRFVINRMLPNDTFNIIDFNVGARMLFSEPKPNTKDNREKALGYLAKLEARGGTWIGPAVEAAVKNPAPENRLRIVTFMTDGYVGNDFEIIGLVQKLRGQSRWFPFGTGNSVNRFLLDKMASVGGGESEYILLNSPGEEIAQKFYKRIAEPVLTDIKFTTKDVELTNTYPGEVSDLWANKPLIFKARYSKPGKGSVILTGLCGGAEYKEILNLELPERAEANSALASLWARAKVDDLMNQEWINIQSHSPSKEIRDQIVSVALAHRLMTQYTSFVAVEEKIITEGGKPVTIAVPVELPHGVSDERIFGTAQSAPAAAPVARNYAMFGASPRMTPHAESKMKMADAAHAPTEKLKKENELQEMKSPQGKLSEDLVQLMRDYEKGEKIDITKYSVEGDAVKVKITYSGEKDKFISSLSTHGIHLVHPVYDEQSVVAFVKIKELDLLGKIEMVKLVQAEK